MISVPPQPTIFRLSRERSEPLKLSFFIRLSQTIQKEGIKQLFICLRVIHLINFCHFGFLEKMMTRISRDETCIAFEGVIFAINLV